jgi:SAM-dependent methyltransferase
VDAVPASEVAPRFGWVTYNEAEGHLDNLVERLRRLGAWEPGAVVGGISYKDTTTLARLAAAGAATTWEIGAADLGLPPGRVEVDAVQDRLDEACAQAIAARRPSADILFVRHVLEHAHDLPGFLRAVGTLVKPGGWLVFEAPDASEMLERFDYSPVWEEHLVYFTEATLAATLAHHGFSVVDAVVYPYRFENALVTIVRRGAFSAPAALAPDGRKRARAAALAFFEGFEATRRRHQAALASARAPVRPVALLGAGHLACTYLGLMRVGSCLDCVIDEDPARAGLFMPGSRLPILGSEALLARGVRLCLLGVNPLVEDRVVARHRAFTDGGGTFRSIFAASGRALVEPWP